MTHTLLRANAVVVLLAAFVGGCSPDPKAGVLTGTITIGGKSPVGAEVYVVGGIGSNEYAATCTVQPDGTYFVDRVGVGSVRIALKPGIPSADADSVVPGAGIPKKYQNPETSGLVVPVQPGPQTFDIRIE